MAKIYVIGSFKDLETSRLAVERIKGAGFDPLISNPGDPRGIDGCLSRVDDADVIYVSNPRGDVGKSVSIDIGYAIAKRKPIYSLRPISDPPIFHLIKGVMEIDALLDHIKRL
ncbi:MAG: nucleoside 2-deoxyribosyltransferase [Oligoflexia bacterium]|nr:nucleoside 2-deoxyribosyltransferase [Oligoflexia bacterium]